MKGIFSIRLLVTQLTLCLVALGSHWELARQNADTLRFSTLFTANDVREYLQTEQGRDDAVGWCQENGVTHVYLESFRGGYLVPLGVMSGAINRFKTEGFHVSGCVTTVGIGRESVDGWIFPCFTERGGLENLKHIFEYTAMQFDEIMIDDFFATRCQCPDCLAGKGESSWATFRNDTLVEVSRKYVIDPVRKVNPNCQLIIKYPQWYEEFQDKGYDVARQTLMFDKTWVGTETRDPDNPEWGRHPQYMAYFIMRWLGVNGAGKCGGGWFDPYGTSAETYVEQARQTILGGADQALLFCYGSLQKGNGPENTRAFRAELESLFQLAKMIHGRPIRGVHAPKPPNSASEADSYLYDFIGMLGLPLVPAETFDPNAESALLGYQVLAESDAAEKIRRYRDSGKPALITETLWRKLASQLQENLGNMQMLTVPEDKWDWMELDADAINRMRNLLLRPLGVELEAPSRVALYLFGEDLVVLENFNPDPVNVKLGLDGSRGLKPALVVNPGQSVQWKGQEGDNLLTIPGRTLVVLR